MEKKKLSISLKIAQLLTIVGALILSVESRLSMQGRSLCRTSGCEVVGHYIRFGEPLLVAGGALFLWLLGAVFFFFFRYPKQLSSLPFLFLLPCLAFDGALIGFQVFTVQRICLLCFGVALLLCCITLLYSVSRRSWLIFLAGSLVWTGGVTASGIIEMPEPSGAYNSMVLIRQQAIGPTEHPDLTMTLVFSMNCPHCQEVISYLAKHPLPGINWRLAAIDQDTESLRRLGYFLQLAGNTSNIFTALHKSETGPVPRETIPKTATIKQHNKKALSFLVNNGTNSIPLLIIEHSKRKREYISGTREILAVLKKNHTSSLGDTIVNPPPSPRQNQ